MLAAVTLTLTLTLTHTHTHTEQTRSHKDGFPYKSFWQNFDRHAKWMSYSVRRWHYHTWWAMRWWYVCVTQAKTCYSLHKTQTYILLTNNMHVHTTKQSTYIHVDRNVVTCVCYFVLNCFTVVLTVIWCVFVDRQHSWVGWLWQLYHGTWVEMCGCPEHLFRCEWQNEMGKF